MKYSAADVSARTPTCFSSAKRNASSESNTLSDTRSRDLTVWVTWVGVSSLGQRPPPPPYRHTTSSAVRAAAKTDYDDLPCLPSLSCFSLEAVTLLSGLFFSLCFFPLNFHEWTASRSCVQNPEGHLQLFNSTKENGPAARCSRAV